MDIFSTEKRSRIMATVHGQNTKPERVVRCTLHKLGYRFRIHRKDLPGKPDIVLPKHHTAIFVHGCFWHQHPGCRKATYPQSNADFWRNKLDGNVSRDARSQTLLSEKGWKVIVIWECEVKNTVLLEERLRKIGTEGI